MLTTLICATALHVSPLPDADAAAPLVYRSFSLSDLRVSAPAEYEAVSPYPYVHEDHGSVHHGDEHELELHGLLESLIYEVVAPDEFEYEGRVLHFTEDDRLVVRAPEDVVGRVGALVDYVQSALHRRVEVAITVRELGVDEDGPSGEPQPGEVVHREQRSIALERTAIMGAPVRQAFVRAWDSEIAQRSAIASPELDELLGGLEMLLRVEEAAGGYRLRHVARMAELHELEEREGRRLDRVMLDNQVWTGGGEVLQLPNVGVAFCAGTQVVRVGDGVNQALWIDTESGWVGWSLEVELLSVEDAPAPLTVNGQAIRFVPASAAFLPSMRVDAPRAAWLGDTRHDGVIQFDELDEPPHVHLLEEYSQTDDVISLALDALGDDGSFFIMALGSGALLAGNPQSVARGAELITSSAAAQRNVIVELGIGEDVARAVLGIETGSDGMLSLGAARALYVHSEVDVATGAAATRPVVSELLDGLMLRVRAGETSVRVQGLVQRLFDVVAGPEDLDLAEYAQSSVDARVDLDGRAHTLANVGGESLWVRASLR